MKKALALVLALVLALSLGVSAFALTLVPLSPAPVAGTALKPVTALPALDKDNEVVLLAGAGETYYVQLDRKDYKDVAVSATGAVSAKVVKYDPTVYAPVDSIPYYVWDSIAGKAVDINVVGPTVVAAAKPGEASYSYGAAGWSYIAKDGAVSYGVTSYAHISAICDILNKADKTTTYVPKTDADLTLIEITVEDNYSVAYKEGSVKITAKEGRTPVSATITVISDVTLFKYDDVKYAAFYGADLKTFSDGYSDYLTTEKGYVNPAQNDASINREEDATVVPTTGFRAIVGEDLGVQAAAGLRVDIYDIAEGQKGVNFEADGVYALNAKGKPANKDAVGIYFGFLGDQKIASEFEVKVDLGRTWFELREEFGKKVEEEDVLTYYILKDGKAFSSFTVDYRDIDPNEKVELTIEGKAGETLGYYELVLEAPAAPEAPAEENPNTGAESVIGVVAAMAVVSVAAAAAVSLKK